MRSHIYLQSDFWTQISSDSSVEGIRACMNVYDALQDANISTDINVEQLKTSLTDSKHFPFDRILFQLFKDRFAGKGGSIDFEYAIEPINDSIDQLCAIHLHDLDNATSSKIEEKWGILLFNSSQIVKKKELFKGSGVMLQKGILYRERFGKFAPIIKIPCNSMIIIDPYILANPHNIENSFVSWLDCVLPNCNLSVDFHLSILSMINDEKGNQLYGEGVKYIYEKIYKIIKGLRKGLRFALTIYSIGKGEDFHSRNILTNNVLIQAPDGLDVYKPNGEAKRNAVFGLVIPRLYGDERLDMTQYMKWIKIVKRRCMNASDTTYYGSRENRLFDLV